MLEILICWGLAAIIGAAWGLIKRSEMQGAGGLTEEKQEGAGVEDISDLRDLLENGTPGYLADMLAGAMKEAKGRGVSSRDLMLLDCCVRHAMAGDLDRSTAVYLLDRLGLQAWADKIKGAGA